MPQYKNILCNSGIIHAPWFGGNSCHSLFWQFEEPRTNLEVLATGALLKLVAGIKTKYGSLNISFLHRAEFVGMCADSFC